MSNNNIKASDTKPIYKQIYRKLWEDVPEFKGWLRGVPNDPNKAYCSHCDKYLHAHRLSLMKHTSTIRHEKATQAHLRKIGEKVSRHASSLKLQEFEPKVCRIEMTELEDAKLQFSTPDMTQNIASTELILIGNAENNVIEKKHRQDIYSGDNDPDEQEENLSMESTNDDYVDYDETIGLSNVHSDDQAEMANSPVTTHILDTSTGRPASNVQITFCKLLDGQWIQLNEGRTNDDGRLRSLIEQPLFTEGCYKLQFHTGEYFERIGQSSFYPFIEIVFNVTEPEEHYHVPLLLSPFGYSTYRGS